MQTRLDPVAMFQSASEFLDPGVARAEWARVVMAAKSAEDSELMREAVEAWSSRGANYNAANFAATWRSIRPGGGITFATLIHLAREAGWRGNSPGNAASRPVAPPAAPKADSPPPALRLASAEGAAAIYVFCDEHGQVRYRKIRIYDAAGKKLTPYQVWRDGQWWTGPGCMESVERLLYRLLRIIGAKVIYITEGEKCADVMVDFGFAACCTDGGCSPNSWRPEFNRYFQGADVRILPDNDERGRAYAAHVARSVYGVARSVRIIDLPGLGPAQDVADFIAGGGLGS